MRTAGIVIILLGGLSLLGCLIGGRNTVGPLFWIGLGIFLIHLANQKKQEKEDKDIWSNKE